MQEYMWYPIHRGETRESISIIEMEWAHFKNKSYAGEQEWEKYNDILPNYKSFSRKLLHALTELCQNCNPAVLRDY